MVRRHLLSIPVILLTISAVHPTAPVVTPGDSVRIAEEHAIILWNSRTETQHLILRASIETDAPDLGLLVPTPTKPELAEADDTAFSLMQDITAPRKEVVERKVGRGGSYRDMPLPGGSVSSVRVLEEKRVAGYNAVVLEANDADALARWLTTHKYSTRPELQAWLKSYVEKKWKITAFKIVKDNLTLTTVATSAVRMSFQTKQPLYPFSEPSYLRRGPGAATPRLLRIYFVGDGRVQGQLGEGKIMWQSRVVWANHLAASHRNQLLDKLKLTEESLPTGLWLTEFEDQALLRMGTADVLFSPETVSAPLERPPVIQYHDVEVGLQRMDISRRWAILGGVLGLFVFFSGLAALIFRRVEMPS